MLPAWKPVAQLDEIVAQAQEECRAGAQYALTLASEFGTDLLRSSFVEAHRAKAADWISADPPKSLYFSHGQFFRGKMGFQHVVDELRSKRNSRRAMLSLLSMDDIIGKGDDPIPAFILLQFSLDGDTLMVAAYFRALEVCRFFPTNVGEIALHCDTLHTHFPGIQKIRLFVFAFRAYCEPEFSCLERAELDVQPAGTVAIAVVQNEHALLRHWLDDKRRFRSSVIDLEGLEELSNGLHKATGYQPAFVGAIDRALGHLRNMKVLRQKSSEGEALDRVRRAFVHELESALTYLPEQK